MDGAAVGERATEDESASIDAIAPDAVRNGDAVARDDGAHGAAGADHEGKAVRCDAAAADIAAGAIAKSGKPGDAVQLRPAIAELGAKLRARRVEILLARELIGLHREEIHPFAVIVV